MLFPFVMHSSKCYKIQETLKLFTSAEPRSKDYQMLMACYSRLIQPRMPMFFSFSTFAVYAHGNTGQDRHRMA